VGGFRAEFLAFFGARDAREDVLVHVEELLAVRGQGDALAGGVLVDVGLVHAAAQRGEVAGLLEAFYGRLPARGQVDVPTAEGANDEPDDAGDDAQHDVVDGHQALDVGGVGGKDLLPHPGARGGEAEEAEEGGVDEEEQEGLVVVQADAGGQPGAVVVHLEHAAAAGRAVVGAVGLAGLALFAEAQFAVGLDGEGGGLGRDVGRQRAVAMVVGRAAGRVEDGSRVAPVEQEVEEDADGGRGFAWRGEK
jgi:hypothetical protein